LGISLTLIWLLCIQEVVIPRRKKIIRRDNKINTDFLKLRKALNVAKKEKELQTNSDRITG